MSPEQLLTITRKKGIVLKTQRDQLSFKAPCGSMTPELVESLKQHKPEIIKILSRKIPNCLGISCQFCRYEQKDIIFLWCDKIDGPVIDLPRCPFGYWEKDEKGFPLPDKKDRVMLAHHTRPLKN